MNGADLVVLSPRALFVAALILGLSALLHSCLLWRALFNQLPSPRLHSLRPLTVTLLAFAAAVLLIVFQASFGLARWEFIPLATALALGVLASCCSPIAAITFLIWNLIVRPWEVFPGSAILPFLPRGLALLAVVGWAMTSLLQGRIRLILDLSVHAFFFLLLALLVSACFADNPGDSLSYLSAQFIPIAVVFLLLINLVEKQEEQKLVINTVLIAVLGATLAAVVLTWVDPQQRALAGGRLVGLGLLSNANDLAAIIVMTVPFLFATLAGEKPSSLASLLLILSGGIALAGLWTAQSRAVLLAVVLSALVYLLLAIGSRHKFMVIALVLIVFPILWSATSARRDSDLALSKIARVNYIKTGIKMFKQSPLIGVGAGNYPRLYERYSGLLIERGQRTAHSSWVLILAEAGILGLCAFGLFFLVALSRAWRLRKIAPEYLVAFAGYSVKLSLLSHAYLFLPYLLCALVLLRYKLWRLGEKSGSST